MDASNVFFVYLLVLPLFVPLILGVIIWIRFSSDKLSRLASLFTLKPILAYPLWFFIFLSGFRNLSNPDPGTELLSLLPGAILSVAIVYRYRDLINEDGLAKWFLGLDIYRMFNTLLFMEATFANITGYIFLFIGLVLPSAYAVFALIAAIRRNKMFVSPQ